MDEITREPEVIFEYLSSVSFVLVRTQRPIPIWRKPLAAAANPSPRALLIFQVATEKVLLPPNREGIDETDIGVNKLSILLKKRLY